MVKNTEPVFRLVKPLSYIILLVFSIEDLFFLSLSQFFNKVWKRSGLCGALQVSILEVEEYLSEVIWIKRSHDTSGISIEPCSFQEDLREVMMDGSKYNSDVL